MKAIIIVVATILLLFVITKAGSTNTYTDKKSQSINWYLVGVSGTVDMNKRAR